MTLDPFSNPSFSPLPPEKKEIDDTLPSDFTADLQDVVVNRVKEEMALPLNEEISGAIENFERSLAEKVRTKTLQTILSELSLHEGVMAKKVSDEFLLAYRKKILSADLAKTMRLLGQNTLTHEVPIPPLEEEVPFILLKEEKTPLASNSVQPTKGKEDLTPLSAPEMDSLTKTPKEEEVDVYLGYPSSTKVSSPPHRPPHKKHHHHPKGDPSLFANPMVPKPESSPSLFERQSATFFRKKFFILLLCWDFFWGVLGTVLLFLCLPNVFFREPNPLWALGMMTIVLGIVHRSENRYFHHHGLFISLHQGKLLFRPMAYALKVIFWTLFLSFLLLMEVQIHGPFVDWQVISPLEWWMVTTNHFFLNIFSFISPLFIAFFQKAVFFFLLILTLWRIVCWLITKEEN